VSAAIFSTRPVPIGCASKKTAKSVCATNMPFPHIWATNCRTEMPRLSDIVPHTDDERKGNPWPRAEEEDKKSQPRMKHRLNTDGGKANAKTRYLLICVSSVFHPWPFPPIRGSAFRPWPPGRSGL
jgi:hypothetical protein